MKDAYGTELAVGDIVSIATRVDIPRSNDRWGRSDFRLSQSRMKVAKLTAKRVGVVSTDTVLDTIWPRIEEALHPEWVAPRQVVKL